MRIPYFDVIFKRLLIVTEATTTLILSASNAMKALNGTEISSCDIVLLDYCNTVVVAAGGGGVERLAWQVEMENKRLRAMKTCKICLEADIGVILMPCGHLVCCHGCASLLSRCTLCQTTVTDTVTVYMT